MRTTSLLLIAPLVLASAATAARAAPGALTPPILGRMAKATYGDSHYDPSTINGLLAKYDKVAAAFEERWKAFAARKAEVDRAIAAADALAKAGKYDDAIAAVTAVITPVPRDERGQLPRKRELLEVRDAETDAVLAWSRYAEAKQDVAATPDIAAALYVRRKAGAELDEELLWFGDVEFKSIGFLAGDDADVARLKQAVDDATHAREDGHALAWGYYKALEAHFGLVKTVPEDPGRAKKGGGAIMDLVPTSIDDKKLAFKEDEEWNEPYDCHETDKVDAIDPDTGKVSYKEACQYRTVQRHTQLRGTFATPPPAWARGGDAPITIAGHVDTAGPKWVLSDVRVLDFRFIKGGDDNATGNILDLMGQ